MRKSRAKNGLVLIKIIKQPTKWHKIWFFSFIECSNNVIKTKKNLHTLFLSFLFFVKGGKPRNTIFSICLAKLIVIRHLLLNSQQNGSIPLIKPWNLIKILHLTCKCEKNTKFKSHTYSELFKGWVSRYFMYKHTFCIQ